MLNSWHPPPKKKWSFELVLFACGQKEKQETLWHYARNALVTSTAWLLFLLEHAVTQAWLGTFCSAENQSLSSDRSTQFTRKSPVECNPSTWDMQLRDPGSKWPLSLSFHFFPGAVHHHVHRLPRAYILVFSRLFGREREEPTEVWDVRWRPLVGSGEY